jgi:hypothetical protein
MPAASFYFNPCKMDYISSTLRTITGALSLIVLMGGCSGGIQTSSTTTKGVELYNYKTYAWAKPGDAEEESRKDDKIFSGLIVESANAELKKKGFKLDAENPDAVLLFDTRVDERTDYTQNPYVSVGVGFGGPGYYGGFTPMATGGQFVAHETVKGMLFIEMYDRKTQKLLWKGWAEEEITHKNDIESDIRTAVKHIFMRLPVKHKQ